MSKDKSPSLIQDSLGQSDTFHKNLEFIAYVDQLKKIIRKNGLFDGSRKENTAEHSWHAALSAQLLAPYANTPVDVEKVTRMLLIHDLIEIEAGDVFIYDPAERLNQEKAEKQAAEIVFGKLPEDVEKALKALWEEFESRKTPEAKFAKAIDRFLPLFSNYQNGGYSWQPYDISQAQVRKVASIIQEGSEILWHLVEDMLNEAVQERYLNP